MKLKMMIAAIGTFLCLMGTYQAAEAQPGRVSANINVRLGNGGYYGNPYGYNDGYYARGYRDRYYDRGYRRGYNGRGYGYGRRYGHNRYAHDCRHRHVHHRGCGSGYRGYSYRGW